MSADLLAVDRVIKSYAFGGLFGRGAFNAVEDVSFSLETARPEIFTIVGESGSGKTTLARMVLNLIAPTSGAIRFRGTEPVHHPRRPRADGLHARRAAHLSEPV